MTLDDFKNIDNEEEIIDKFCKKYSRIKMETASNVWKRIDFEVYKRQTKKQRIDSLKDTLKEKQKTPVKNKCFDRLHEDSVKRKEAKRVV